MSVLLITYDLKRPGQDYPDLLKYIKGHAWARLSESSYAIETSLSPSAVLAQARKFIDANDTIFVITLTSPWDGFGPKDVIEWLQKRLPVTSPAWRF